MRDKLLLGAALFAVVHQTNPYVLAEELAQPGTTQNSEAQTTTATTPTPVTTSSQAPASEAETTETQPEEEITTPVEEPETDGSEDAPAEEGTDEDFPVETDDEKAERLERERIQEDEAVKQDYQNAYDQSEDFDPEAIDSEYGLDNYYQSGQNNFDNEY